MNFRTCKVCEDEYDADKYSYTCPHELRQTKEEANEDSDIICPFCSDTGFDREGLKYHLTYYCEVYQEMEIEPRRY